MLDLAIRGARIVSEDGVLDGAIGVAGGRITFVGRSGELPPARRVIDAGGQYAIPGLIDSHVHLRGGRAGSHDEVWARTFASEGRAALHGGVTTVGVFSWSEPGQAVRPGIESMRREGERHSPVDFFPHAVITRPEHVTEVAALAREVGCWSFKQFFNANKSRPDQVNHSVYPGVENETFLATLREVAALGAPAIGMAHCEDQDIAWRLEDELRAVGRNDLRAWAEARPGWIEHLRMRIAYEIARAARAPLYIVHVAAAEGVKLLEQARRGGEPYWGETCPHYLTHTADMEAEIGCWGRVNTAIKFQRDQDALWAGIRSGAISNMGTDHSSFAREIKEGGGGKHGNIWNARSGINGGLEHWLPVMLTHGVAAGRITMEQLVAVCSTNNARVFGLYPRKGVIRPGADADIVIVDPDAQATIDAGWYWSGADWTIYDGWTMRGLPRVVVAGGEVLVDAFAPVDSGRRGRYLVPEAPAQPAVRPAGPAWPAAW